VPRDSVLIGRQLLAPLFIGFLDLRHVHHQTDRR
jgi:hypothetical protein